MLDRKLWKNTWMELTEDDRHHAGLENLVNKIRNVVLTNISFKHQQELVESKNIQYISIYLKFSDVDGPNLCRVKK